MENNKIDFVLASRSPRRRDALNLIGLPFRVYVPNVSEEYEPGSSPRETVMGLSSRKARKAYEAESKAFIIAADTVVSLDGMILEKPGSRAEAEDMLHRLSGKSHEVYTGISLFYRDKLVIDFDVTKVYFRDLTENEIESYIDSGSPFDKAGSYGIQDRAGAFVRRIEGDYLNVTGFPLCKMIELMKTEYGIDYEKYIL